MSLPEATGTPDDTSGPVSAEPDSAVRPRLTVKRRSKRPRKDVETMEFIGAARRFLRAAGKRAGDADEFELAALLSLRGDLDEAIAVAVAGQRARGRSWAYIGQAAGMKRESAYEKWNEK